MGKIDFFSVFLNKDNPIYFGGETLKGTLRLRLRERLKINSLKISVHGIARVRWSERKNNPKTTMTVNYTKSEKYLYHDLEFLKKEANSDLFLEPDDYSFPFETQLPSNLPTSFDHSFGKIRYSIIGCINIPWSFDKYTKKSFTLISHLDLNLNPSLRQSYGVSGQKTFCCGPCKSEPILIKFDVFKCGYVSGEGIVFNVMINNKTNKEIKDISVSLIQIIRFHTPQKSKTCYRNVASIKFSNKVGPMSSKNWDNSVLVIPAVSQTSLNASKLIKVNYEVWLNYNADGQEVRKDLRIPIVIGTIPFKATNEQEMDIPYSYEPCIFETDNSYEVNNEDKNAEIIETDFNNYKPFYLYYKNLSNKKI